jgi:hypothetical protein
MLVYCVKVGRGREVQTTLGIYVRLVFGPTYYTRSCASSGIAVFDDLPKSLPTDEPEVYVNGVKCSGVHWRKDGDKARLARVPAYRTVKREDESTSHL